MPHSINTIQLRIAPSSKGKPDETPPFEGAAWFDVEDGPGDIVHYPMTAGTAADARWISLDILPDTEHFLTCRLCLRIGARTVWNAQIMAWLDMQVRHVFRLPDNLPKEPIDGASLVLQRKRPEPARLAAGYLTLSADKPPVLENPALPHGPLYDKFGQNRLATWPEKTTSPDQLRERLLTVTAAPATPPADRSRWGGWKDRNLGGTGFFRTQHDGRRWWLVDPDGFLFWSAGATCAHPSIDREILIRDHHQNYVPALDWMPPRDDGYADAYGHNPWHAPGNQELNFSIVNFIRVFGPHQWRQKWEEATFGEMRRIGLNTAGDWSDEDAAHRAGMPYCRPLELGFSFPHAPFIAGNLPDVFAPGFAADAARYARQLECTAEDPAMLGYFMHNEPSWHCDMDGTPVEAMLRNAKPCHSRTAFADWLRQRYGNDTAAASAWEMPYSPEDIAQGRSCTAFSTAAIRDMESFSTVILTRLIAFLSEACRKADPNHLNLGVRWWTFPKHWALAAMGACDVISFNCYWRVPGPLHYGDPAPDPRSLAILEKLNRPFMVGEWHFGSFRPGVKAAGLQAVADEPARAAAIRNYLEQGAALPWLVGAHYFNLYDNTFANNGLIDIAQQRHETVCRALRTTLDHLYAVANGDIEPFSADIPLIVPSR